MKVEVGSYKGINGLQTDFGDFANDALKQQKGWSKEKKAKFRSFFKKITGKMFEVVHDNVTVRGHDWEDGPDNDFEPKDRDLKTQLVQTQTEVLDLIEKVVTYRKNAAELVKKEVALDISSFSDAEPIAEEEVQDNDVLSLRAGQLETVLKQLKKLGKASQKLLGDYKSLDEATQMQISIADSKLESLIKNSIVGEPAVFNADDDNEHQSPSTSTAPSTSTSSSSKKGKEPMKQLHHHQQHHDQSNRAALTRTPQLQSPSEVQNTSRLRRSSRTSSTRISPAVMNNGSASASMTTPTPAGKKSSTTTTTTPSSPKSKTKTKTSASKSVSRSPTAKKQSVVVHSPRSPNKRNPRTSTTSTTTTIASASTLTPTSSSLSLSPSMSLQSVSTKRGKGRVVHSPKRSSTQTRSPVNSAVKSTISTSSTSSTSSSLPASSSPTSTATTSSSSLTSSSTPTIADEATAFRGRALGRTPPKRKRSNEEQPTNGSQSIDADTTETLNSTFSLDDAGNRVEHTLTLPMAGPLLSHPTKTRPSAPRTLRSNTPLSKSSNGFELQAAFTSTPKVVDQPKVRRTPLARTPRSSGRLQKKLKNTVDRV